MRGNFKTLWKVSNVWVGTFDMCVSERERSSHQQSPWRIPVVKRSRLLKQTSGEACKRNFRPPQKDDHTIASELLWKINRVYMLLPQTDTHKHIHTLLCLIVDLFCGEVVSHFFFSCGWHYLKFAFLCQASFRANFLCLRLPAHWPAVF